MKKMIDEIWDGEISPQDIVGILVYDQVENRSYTPKELTYTTTEYASHNTSAQYEQYSASQHKKYSYCADCNSTVGATSYEGHTFTNSTLNGQVVSTCSLCGYTKTSAQTYTVSYNANGGYNAPSSQTKVHGVTLTLSSSVPYRFNYEFVGWATNSNSSVASYYAGGSYTDNASVTLYAVWRYGNLILVDKSVHSLIHAIRKETIENYKEILNLSQKQVERVNKLRGIIGLESI